LKSLNWILSLSLLGLTIGMAACESGPEWKKRKFTKFEFSVVSTSVELPTSLWRKIESMISSKAGAEGAETAGGAPAGGAEGGEDSTLVQKALPTEFAPLQVYLIEKNRGILKKRDVQFSFGPGGGEIDLAEFVESLNGSLYLVAEFLPEAADVTARKVFYLSNAVARTVEGEKVGAGCNTYFDVTGVFAKSLLKDGILVNTRSNRHISALAGTYFFAAVQHGKLMLSSLIIRDSRYRKLQCR
jgi:hypothetical protein